MESNMDKKQEEECMWLLKKLPEDQQQAAHTKIINAFQSGWSQLDFYQKEGPFHHCDLVGVDPNKEFNFIPNEEGNKHANSL